MRLMILLQLQYSFIGNIVLNEKKERRYKIKQSLMIKALVNSSWKLFDIDELQTGASVFNFETGLYETIKTRNHRPTLLTPHLDHLFNSAK